MFGLFGSRFVQALRRWLTVKVHVSLRRRFSIDSHTHLARLKPVQKYSLGNTTVCCLKSFRPGYLQNDIVFCGLDTGKMEIAELITCVIYTHIHASCIHYALPVSVVDSFLQPRCVFNYACIGHMVVLHDTASTVSVTRSADALFI